MGKDKFEAEMGKADNHFTSDILISAKRELQSWDKTEAKIIRSNNGWKILGQGQEFKTVEEAIEFQYAAEMPGAKFKTKKKSENYLTNVKETAQSKVLDQLEILYA